jgi:crossover junction endodeoxyribonuclease RuvC
MGNPIPKRFLGIDPGKSGGLVVISGKTVRTYVMPETESDIWRLVDELPRISFALIEKVHAMPKQGVSSSFTFGAGYGGLRMALIARRITLIEVVCSSWQKAAGIPPRKKTEGQPQFKKRIRAKAQQLYPKIDVWEIGWMKHQLAICDALLIARYARETQLGKGSQPHIERKLG